MQREITICALAFGLMSCNSSPVKTVDGEKIIELPKKCIGENHILDYSPKEKLWNLNCLDSQNRRLFYYFQENQDRWWIGGYKTIRR